MLRIIHKRTRLRVCEIHAMLYQIKLNLTHAGCWNLCLGQRDGKKAAGKQSAGPVYDINLLCPKNIAAVYFNTLLFSITSCSIWFDKNESYLKKSDAISRAMFVIEMSTIQILVSGAKMYFISMQAFNNVLKRMLEAEGRGMWAPDKDTLAKLQNMYSDMDSQLEGVAWFATTLSFVHTSLLYHFIDHVCMR